MEGFTFEARPNTTYGFGVWCEDQGGLVMRIHEVEFNGEATKYLEDVDGFIAPEASPDGVKIIGGNSDTMERVCLIDGFTHPFMQFLHQAGYIPVWHRD